MSQSDAPTELAEAQGQLWVLLAAVRRVIECAVVRPEVELPSNAVSDRTLALKRWFEVAPPRADAAHRSRADGERACLAAGGRLEELRRWSAEVHEALALAASPDWRRGWELIQQIDLGWTAADVRAEEPPGQQRALQQRLDSIRRWSFDALVEAQGPEGAVRGRPMLTEIGPPLDVLVVDDEPDIRELIAINVLMDGYRAWTASDGREGYMAAAELQPDVIVLGVSMPVMDGWEACQLLRADPRTADIPIVLCTARCSDLDVLRGYVEGADAFLSKPFQLVALRHLIAAAARRGRRNALPDERFYPWRAVGLVNLPAAVAHQAAQAASEAMLRDDGVRCANSSSDGRDPHSVEHRSKTKLKTVDSPKAFGVLEIQVPALAVAGFAHVLDRRALSEEDRAKAWDRMTYDALRLSQALDRVGPEDAQRALSREFGIDYAWLRESVADLRVLITRRGNLAEIVTAADLIAAPFYAE